MRVLAFFLFFSSIIYAHSQIPNGGFDQWTNLSSPSLQDWDEIGNVYRSTDAVSGNYSLRLENNGDLGTFGAIANVELENNLEGGQPYDEIPLVMSFWCKYDLAQGDVGKVYAIFQASGQPLGTVDFTISGSSADTFVNFKFPIQWVTQVTPDTVIVVAATTDLITPSVNGDGYMILDHIEFKTFSTLHDSVINHDFEDWDELNIPYPEEWFTTDVFLKQEFNFPFHLESVSSAAEVQSGSAAIKLRNVEFDNELFPGIAVTGNSLKGLEGASFPANRRWKYFHGLYRYDRDSTDVASVVVTFFKDGTLIGAAQQDFDKDQLDEYKYFYQPITYLNASVPDSASVIIACADPEDPLGMSTTLWIDNLSFTDHTADINESLSMGLMVYPNPVKDILHINRPNPEQTYYELMNLEGRKVLEGTGTQINLSNLPSQVYILRVRDAEVSSTLKIVKL